MMCYELQNIAIFNVKNVNYRYVLWNMTYDEAFSLLNNSMKRVHYKLNFLAITQKKGPNDMKLVNDVLQIEFFV